MTKRRKPTPERPREWQEGKPFEFPENEARELLRLLGEKAPIEKRMRFIADLTRLIRLYRSVKYGDEVLPPGSQIREQLRQLNAAFEAFRSKLEEIEPRAQLVETTYGPGLTPVSDPLHDLARERFERAVLPALRFWFKDLLKDDRWCRRLPPESRYFVIFLSALRDIGERLALSFQPTKEEVKGGRPKMRAKQEFVRHILRLHSATFGKFPSTSKEGAFENLVRQALDAVGYKAGNANEVVRKALLAVKAEVAT